MARNITEIKKEFGSNCFKNWGKKGGSPYLKALQRGDTLVIRHKKKSRKA